MAGYIMDKKDDKIRIKSQELDPVRYLFKTNNGNILII